MTASDEGTESRQSRLGVAISGGGHRAALWGVGVLLFLVDSGLNRNVTSIASVSGGSITNGVVGLETNYRTTDRNQFRTTIKPLLEHITKDGLFFYGSTTNSYLVWMFGVAAATAATWLVVTGSIVYKVGREILLLFGRVKEETVETLTLWPIGTAVLVAFLAVAVGSYLYTDVWDWSVGTLSLLGIVLGAGLIVWDLTVQPVEWMLLPAVSVLAALAVMSTLVAAGMFGRRSDVAETAMREVHFGDSTLSSLGEQAASDNVRHVFCATEMQSGLHAFFTRDFIYSYSYGLTDNTSTTSLAFAVQASAALPGGFSPRRLDTTDLNFQPAGGEPAAGPGDPMILLDGGVYDNMADQWFVGLKRRRDRWPDSYAAKLPVVDDLVVANASTGWSWRPLGWLALRVRELREATALIRVQSVMYNTVGRRRRAHLIDWWNCDPDVRGALVEVDDNPEKKASDTLSERVNEIAPPEGWATLVEQSRTYPTVLRQIAPDVAVKIIWHAYIVTALAANKYLSAPVSPDDLPLLDDFVKGLAVTQSA